MPQYKSVVSGVTVTVSNETAELIGSEWEPVEKKRTVKKTDDE